MAKALWTIKKVKNRQVILHQHDLHWTEAYEKDDQVFCCECDEEHKDAVTRFLLEPEIRPNNKAYIIVDNYYRRAELQIKPHPPTNVDEWNDYGHIHKESSWKPIKLPDGKIACPKCLELAPEPIVGEFTQVDNIEKPFWTMVKKEDKELKTQVTLY